MHKTGKLEPDSIDESLRVLNHFREKYDEFGVVQSRAVGTSALREAADAGEFLGEAERLAGIHIDVISGEEEARLTAEGVMGGATAPRSLIFDIGGGSTEWIAAGPIVKLASLPLGALRLTGQFFSGPTPPTPAQISELRKNINIVLEGSLLGAFSIDEISNMDVHLTGGSPTALAAMKIGLSAYQGDAVHGTRLEKDEVNRMFDSFSHATREQLAAIPIIGPQRADLIVAGTAIVYGILLRTNHSYATVSDRGLLEGLLLRMRDIAPFPNEAL